MMTMINMSIIIITSSDFCKNRCLLECILLFGLLCPQQQASLKIKHTPMIILIFKMLLFITLPPPIKLTVSRLHQ